VEVNGAEVFRSPNFIGLAESADLILVDSDAVKEMLASLGATLRNKIAVHFNSAADTRRFYPKETAHCRRLLQLPQNAFLIANVSTFQPHHDFSTLIRAFRKVASVLPNAHLMFLGHGPRYEEVRLEIADLREQGRVSMHGSVPILALPTYICAADVCINLFTPAKLVEGNLKAQKLYDYLACGRPAIEAVDFQCELPTWAREGLFLVPAASADEVAKAIHAIAADQEEASARARRARDWVVRNRSWYEVTEITLEHIRRVMGHNEHVDGRGKGGFA